MDAKEKLNGFAKADYYIKKASYVFSWISALCIIFMAFLSTADVISSKVFNHAFSVQRDLIQYMMLPVFATLLWNIQVESGLMRVDIFTRKFGPIGIYISNTVFYILGIIVYGFVGYRCFVYFLTTLKTNTHSGTGTQGIVIWPCELILALGLLLLAFGFVWSLIRMYVMKEPYTEVKRRKEKEEANKNKDKNRRQKDESLKETKKGGDKA